MMNPPAAAAICVCICTYKRPTRLKRSLQGLARQNADGSFNYSVVVADNDGAQSAKQVVGEFDSAIAIAYCVEPRQNIALARNKALEHATGDFVAFLDDDEFPATDWLVTLRKALIEHDAAGVLGPVRPFFDHEPPDWLVRGKFCERPEHQTGVTLHWRQTRTGNVMFRRDILEGLSSPFREEFGDGGEDQDFFRRMMERGHRFVWCNEAVVYEVVPPERCKRRYLLKRALLRGQNEKPLLDGRSIVKSLVAVPVYAVLLTVVWVLGEHVFMKYLIRLFDHAGKLLVATGIRPIREKYLAG
jgi:glycosyltransferase involved in cell wall biosynthesis